MEALQALLSASGDQGTLPTAPAPAPAPAPASAAPAPPTAHATTAPTPEPDEPEAVVDTKPSKALSQSFGRGLGFEAKSGAAPSGDPLAASMAMAEALEVGLPPQASAPSTATAAGRRNRKQSGGLFSCCGKGSKEPRPARPANVVQV